MSQLHIRTCISRPQPDVAHNANNVQKNTTPAAPDRLIKQSSSACLTNELLCGRPQSPSQGARPAPGSRISPTRVRGHKWDPAVPKVANFMSDCVQFCVHENIMPNSFVSIQDGHDDHDVVLAVRATLGLSRCHSSVFAEFAFRKMTKLKEEYGLSKKTSKIVIVSKSFGTHRRLWQRSLHSRNMIFSASRESHGQRHTDVQHHGLTRRWKYLHPRFQRTR